MQAISVPARQDCNLRSAYIREIGRTKIGLVGPGTSILHTLSAGFRATVTLHAPLSSAATVLLSRRIRTKCSTFKLKGFDCLVASVW